MRFIVLLIILMSPLLIFLGADLQPSQPPVFVGPPVAATPAPGVEQQPSEREQAEALLDTTVQIMEVCRAKVSPARGALLAQQLVRILMERKGTQAQREAFVSLVCIESKFDVGATSTAGAVGPAQVMPHLAQSFADICGLGKLAPEDVRDPEVNLQLGSCLFFSLLERFNGNVALALSGYNSGAGSSTTKAVAHLGTGHVETGWYIAKYFALQEKLRVKREATPSEGSGAKAN